eukprot:jgi/Bigna1/67332/fgenesh1_pg.3_\
MPSSLTKGGRGPKNVHRGDRYDQNSFDQNLQDEIYQMTYAAHATEMKNKEEDLKELEGFRQARSTAGLQVDEGKRQQTKSTVASIKLAPTKTKEKEMPTVVVVTKKKKRKRGDCTELNHVGELLHDIVYGGMQKKKKKLKKQKKDKTAATSKTESQENALASLLNGYEDSGDDE